jgi:hypothetical protein
VTKFNVGDRVRLSAQANPERIADIGDMLGTVREVHSFHALVEWDTPNPKWNGPNYDEIELVPAPDAFTIGARVRILSSVYSDPAKTSSGDTVPVGTLGTVVDTSSLYVRVAIDDKAPWSPLFTREEIELAANPTLIETLRAKATAARTEADTAYSEYDAANAAVNVTYDRWYSLHSKANALEAAAKILEEAE